MYPRRVDTDMIHALPLVKYDGETCLIESDEILDAELPLMAKESVLGFDTETRPNFSKGRQYPVSILQLAGESKVWVIRLDPLAHRFADIYKVLENPSIKKAGLAIQGDIKSLKGRHPLNPAGFIDVSTATSKFGIINTGMRNLTALFFGERLSKAAQLTNWANESLTDKQIEYAATDAWMSRRLFLEIKKCMAENKNLLEPEPPPEPQKFNLQKFVRKIISGIVGSDKKRGGRNRRKKESIKDRLVNMITFGAAKKKKADDRPKRRRRRKSASGAPQNKGGEAAKKTATKRPPAKGDSTTPRRPKKRTKKPSEEK